MKTKTQHTPGPWVVSSEQTPFLPKQNGGGLKLRIMGARSQGVSYHGTDQVAFREALEKSCESYRICTMNVTNLEAAKANACIIAAAPELLMALRLLVAAYDVDCPSRFKGPMLRAEDAIAKAEGSAQ